MKKSKSLITSIYEKIFGTKLIIMDKYDNSNNNLFIEKINLREEIGKIDYANKIKIINKSFAKKFSWTVPDENGIGHYWYENHKVIIHKYIIIYK